jgi:hypothetical protein
MILKLLLIFRLLQGKIKVTVDYKQQPRGIDQLRLKVFFFDGWFSVAGMYLWLGDWDIVPTSSRSSA